MKSTGRRLRFPLVTRGPASGDRARQSGLTLLELLVAIAIVGALGAAAAITTYHLLVSSRQANDEQLIVTQLRNTEHYMTRDILTSQTISPGVSDGFPLVLSWISYDGSSHTATYSLVDSQDGTKILERYKVVNGVSSTLSVADHLDPAGTSCTLSPSGSTVTVNLTATYREVTSTRTFEAKKRSDVSPT